MNLLDLTDDPKTMGLLSLGLRLMSTPGKFGQAFGQAGMGALGDVQAVAQNLERKKQRETEAKAAEQRAAMQALQMQQLQQQIQRQQGVEGAYRNALMSPDQNSLPQLNQDALLRGLAQVDPMRAAEMLQPKQDDYKVVGDALLAVGPGGVKEAYRAPAKPEKLDPNKPFMVIDGKIVPNPAYQQYELARAKAGASSVQVNTGDRIPVPLVKAQDDLIDKMSVARSTDADLGAISKQIASGTLKFGPVRNLINAGKNVAGVSDEESRAFGTFKSTLEKLRNDSLRLNAGVQTEGDAQRAWNELFQNINDTNFVQKRLGEIRNINKRAADLHGYRLNVLRANSGAGPLQPAQIAPAIQSPDSGVVDWGSLK